jgi:hypothetical protein
VRLVTYDDGGGPEAGILTGQAVIPAAAAQPPATTVRGLLTALDAPALAAVGERALSEGQRIELAPS